MIIRLPLFLIISLVSFLAGPLVRAAVIEPPANLRAVQDGGAARINLTWYGTPTTGDFRYRLYRSTTANVTGSVLIDDFNGYAYTDSTVSYNTTYYYQVVAFLGSTVSALSNQYSAKAVVPPPVNVRAIDTKQGNEVKITWDRPALDLPLTYNIYRSSTEGDDGSTIASALGGTEYLDIYAEAGKYRYYRVKSVTSNSILSASSAVAGIAPTDGAPPARPTSLAASLGSDGVIYVSWRAGDSRDSNLTYRLYRSYAQSGFGSQITETTNTSFTDTGQPSGTNIFYRVEARDKNGNQSEISDAVKVSTLSKTAVNLVVTGLKAEARGTSGEINIYWTNPRSPEATADYARVYRSFSATTVGNIVAEKITGTSFSDKGLADGRPYFYQVQIVGTDGKAYPLSNTASATAYRSGQTIPKSPGRVLARDLGDGRSLRVSWELPASTDVKHVNIYRSERPGASGGELVASGITAASFDDTAAKASEQRYYYVIKIVNQAGVESAPSPVVAGLPTLFKLVNTYLDTDGDKLPDDWEQRHGYHPTVENRAEEDDDADGLGVADEFKNNTDPWLADSDGDGYVDGEEVRHGYNPLGPGRINNVLVKKAAPAGQAAATGASKAVSTYAYGQPRVSGTVEQKANQELRAFLQNYFGTTRIPLGNQSWTKLLNAYVYGGYNAEEVALTLRFGPGLVHPTIPAVTWRQSGEYRRHW